MARKKVSKKKATARKSATASADASAKGNGLPQGGDIPQGMKQLGGGYAPTWKPEEIGESLHGTVTAEVREVEFKQGRKTVQRRVMEVTTFEGENRFAVWESAALGELFDQIAEEGAGAEVFLRYDGLGRKKAGQNPPKLFTVAVAG